MWYMSYLTYCHIKTKQTNKNARARAHTRTHTHTHSLSLNQAWPCGVNQKRVKKARRNGGGSFLACEDLEGRFDDSFPVCTFYFLSGDQLAPINSASRPGSTHNSSAS